ncbi:probable cytochrome P450 6a17 [Battus philenor]|uniref:probable cytochrome P450 6a17 n=1 Tax=Battus philenor TaxID=42288 RepID=UPI0035CF90D6
MLFIILILSTIVLYAVLELVIKNRNYWLKRNIPEVNGVTWNFVSGKRSLPEVVKEIYYAHPNEEYIGFYLGIQPALIIKNLENVQAVLSGDFQSFHSRGMIVNQSDAVSDSVPLIDEYEKWRLIRHKITPVFTMKKLKNMFYIVEHCARDFVKFIENNEGNLNKSFDAVYTYTTASIVASVFGINADNENTMYSPFIKVAWKTLEATHWSKLKFGLSVTCPKLFETLQLKMFGTEQDFFLNAIKKALHDRRRSNNKRHDFIDTCIELQNEGLMQNPTSGYKLEPTDDLMAAQAFFFFIAGTDTSGHSMHFTLLELAANSVILKRLHEEIDNVFERCNEKITVNEIEELKYLDMVINEAFRKYPNIGFFQRKCTRRTTLPAGKITIDKDVLVIIPTYAIHRDEKYYSNPDVFDPERFSAENISKIQKHSFLPFGEGNRICIGARFARLQMKVGLAWLLKRYTLKEREYKPDHFEPSFFSLRDTNASVHIIPRGK